jgi:hypothetical protein
MQEELTPLPEEIESAKLSPNGWLYRVSKKYSENEYIPPEAIVGAWKVDSNGCIVGSFIKNEKYDQNLSGEPPSAENNT